MTTLKVPLLSTTHKKTDKKQNVDIDREKKVRVLKNMNIAAFVIHIASFIAALIMSIIYASQSVRAELTTDFRVWEFGTLVTKLTSLGSYQLIWVDLPFPAITAIFHGLVAWVPTINRTYNRWVFAEDRNPLRWIEYSITASLMTWVICQLSGITNVLTLVMVAVVGNVALQLQGYVMETMNIGKTRGSANWVPIVIGWFIFVGQWVIILVYFITAASSSPDIPWFVYVIVFGLLLQFSFFGLIMVFHYLAWPKFLSSGYANEIAYIVLSFTSKLFLTWNLLIGIATSST